MKVDTLKERLNTVTNSSEITAKCHLSEEIENSDESFYPKSSETTAESRRLSDESISSEEALQHCDEPFYRLYHPNSPPSIEFANCDENIEMEKSIDEEVIPEDEGKKINQNMKNICFVCGFKEFMNEKNASGDESLHDKSILNDENNFDWIRCDVCLRGYHRRCTVVSNKNVFLCVISKAK